jgi:hypothetical protein
MKFSKASDYRSEITRLSESALLSLWAKLGDLQEDIVLVGGLVPRYICRPSADGLEPNTLDVDFGIALAAGGSMYLPLSERLASEGFFSERGRFVKKTSRGNFFVDFLTERPTPNSTITAVVDDIGVSAFFGIDRALKICRTVEIEGTDLDGARVRERVKVCEIGPFMCLKLQAYHGRAEKKDLFDVIHTVLYYDGGLKEAIRLFKAEAGLNLAHPVACQVLRDRFEDDKAKGPAAYASFCLEEQSLMIELSEEERVYRYTALANQAVDVAVALLAPAQG